VNGSRKMADEIKPQIKKTWKPIIAGIIDIIGGAYFGFLSLKFIFPFFTGPITSGHSDPETDWFLLPIKILGLALFIIIPAILLFVVASLALTGGTFAIKRKAWILALAGSIVLTLSTFLAPLLQFMINQWRVWIMVILLGPTAIILTALSKKEFE
jgi:hypothetical protein